MHNHIKINFLGIKLTFRNPFVIASNKICLIKNGKVKTLHKVRGLKVKYYGSNNIIEFFDRIPRFKNVRIDCGENSRISFGSSAYKIKNLYINARAQNTSVIIGESFSIESGKFDVHGEPNTKIIIGNDCQFGCNISLDTADGHTIYDESNNQPINLPSDITIGNHVWLCENVTLLKGSMIADNCIVGKNSLVTKKLTDANKVIGGNPAKIIISDKYKNINWSRKANKEFSK